MNTCTATDASYKEEQTHLLGTTQTVVMERTANNMSPLLAISELNVEFGGKTNGERERIYVPYLAAF
jgi:hypothetical protein